MKKSSGGNAHDRRKNRREHLLAADNLPEGVPESLRTKEMREAVEDAKARAEALVYIHALCIKPAPTTKGPGIITQARGIMSRIFDRVPNTVLTTD